MIITGLANCFKYLIEDKWYKNESEVKQAEENINKCMAKGYISMDDYDMLINLLHEKYPEYYPTEEEVTDEDNSNKDDKNNNENPQDNGDNTEETENN